MRTLHEITALLRLKKRNRKSGICVTCNSISCATCTHLVVKLQAQLHGHADVNIHVCGAALYTCQTTIAGAFPLLLVQDSMIVME